MNVSASDIPVLFYEVTDKSGDHADARSTGCADLHQACTSAISVLSSKTSSLDAQLRHRFHTRWAGKPAAAMHKPYIGE
jgi:hypothetical protein